MLTRKRMIALLVMQCFLLGQIGWCMQIDSFEQTDDNLATIRIVESQVVDDETEAKDEETIAKELIASVQEQGESFDPDALRRQAKLALDANWARRNYISTTTLIRIVGEMTSGQHEDDLRLDEALERRVLEALQPLASEQGRSTEKANRLLEPLNVTDGGLYHLMHEDIVYNGLRRWSILQQLREDVRGWVIESDDSDEAKFRRRITSVDSCRVLWSLTQTEAPVEILNMIRQRVAIPESQGGLDWHDTIQQIHWDCNNSQAMARWVQTNLPEARLAPALAFARESEAQPALDAEAGENYKALGDEKRTDWGWAADQTVRPPHWGPMVRGYIDAVTHERGCATAEVRDILAALALGEMNDTQAIDALKNTGAFPEENEAAASALVEAAKAPLSMWRYYSVDPEDVSVWPDGRFTNQLGRSVVKNRDGSFTGSYYDYEAAEQEKERREKEHEEHLRNVKREQQEREAKLSKRRSEEYRVKIDQLMENGWEVDQRGGRPNCIIYDPTSRMYLVGFYRHYNRHEGYNGNIVFITFDHDGASMAKTSTYYVLPDSNSSGKIAIDAAFDYEKRLIYVLYRTPDNFTELEIKALKAGEVESEGQDESSSQNNYILLEEVKSIQVDMEDSNGYFAERDTTRGGDQRLYAGLVVGREGHIFLHCSAYNCYAVPNWRVPTYIERYYRFDNYVYKINTRTGNVESKTCTHNNAGREERHFTSTVNAEQGVLYVLCDDDLQLFGIKEGEYEQPDLTINAPTVRSYSNQVLCTPDNKLLLDAYSILDLDNMQVRRVDSPVSDPHSIIAASFDNLGSNMFAFVLYNFFSDPKYSATLYRKFDTGQIDMQADSEEASQVTIVDKDGRMFTVTDVAQIKEAIQSVLQSQQPEVRPAQVEELAGAETCA